MSDKPFRWRKGENLRWIIYLSGVHPLVCKAKKIIDNANRLPGGPDSHLVQLKVLGPETILYGDKGKNANLIHRIDKRFVFDFDEEHEIVDSIFTQLVNQK
jgi:hypothetical protein